jgi:hypothetical protein
MSQEEQRPHLLTHCAFCEQPMIGDAQALITVRTNAGHTSVVVAHGDCLLPLFHRNVRTVIESGRD